MNNKETAEKAAENKYTQGVYIINGIDICEASRECFVDGAIWQSKRMYSEEDLEEAFKNGFTNCYNNDNLTFGEWFEQFSKLKSN